MVDTMNKHVLITGGGSGIGLACAMKFLAANYKVCITGRDQRRLEVARDSIKSTYPDAEIRTAVCDVKALAQVRSLFADLLAKESMPDILINNAGAFFASPILETSDANALEMLETNLMGPWNFLREAANFAIPTNRELHILNVLSVTALKTFPGCSFYSASKAALKTLMECARLELRGKNIRITNLFPGATETPLWGDLKMDFDKMMNPEDVAEATFNSANSGLSCLIEDIVLRPPSGDL
jgi:NAD(P)-dependent dehydrogenase (short-subunit alcohol dehydrogenase family)